MCIDCITRNVINQVWLQDHGIACDVDREEAKSCWKDLVQLLGTLLGLEDRNPGSLSCSCGVSRCWLAPERGRV